jgi:hypothetical protein
LINIETMKREVRKQRFKLWLLTLVLALVLAWYTLNPAPSSVQPKQRQADPPDAKRQAQAQTASGLFKSKALPALRPARAGGASFAELTDWPEYLDLD